jgi:hypothetical protein
VLRVEEEIWRLKYRSLWLTFGDRNTNFFHKQAKDRLWRNNLREIKTPSDELTSSFDKGGVHSRDSTNLLENISSLVSHE